MRRPQYLQPPAPSRLPVDASDLPIRGGGAMAQRDHRRMTTVRAPVFRLERLNLTVPARCMPRLCLEPSPQLDGDCREWIGPTSQLLGFCFGYTGRVYLSLSK